MLEQKILNILLVEDDEVDVLNVKRAFEKNRIMNPLFIASNGIEALDMLRTAKVPQNRRLVLLDLNLPKMNGIEFLRELRGDSELGSIPVVVLTTSDAEKDKIEAFKLNVGGYLVKPVTFPGFADLMATLNKYWTLVDMP
jgi:CheY-like chemotaxis protein